MGYMVLDTMHIQGILSEGIEGAMNLENLVLREFGQIVGIGYEGWSHDDLVYRSKCTNVWTIDWGCDGSPPLQNNSGDGRKGLHWDEKCMDKIIASLLLCHSPVFD